MLSRTGALIVALVLIVFLIIIAVLCHTYADNDDVEYMRDHKPHKPQKDRHDEHKCDVQKTVHKKKCEIEKTVHKKCEVEKCEVEQTVQKKVIAVGFSPNDMVLMKAYAEARCIDLEFHEKYDHKTCHPVIHGDHVMYEHQKFYTDASYITYLRGLISVTRDYETVQKKTHKCGPKKVLQVFVGQIDEVMARETAEALEFARFGYEAYLYRPELLGSAEEMNFKAAEASLVYVYGDHLHVDAALDKKYELAVANPRSVLTSSERLYAFITFNQYSLQDPHALSLYELVDLAASFYCKKCESSQYSFTSVRGIATLNSEGTKTFRRVHTVPAVFYVPDVCHEQYFIKVGFVSNCLNHAEIFMRAATFAHGASLNVSTHIDVNGDDHNEVIERWIAGGHRIIIVDIIVDAGLEAIIRANPHVLFILNKTQCTYGHNTVSNGAGVGSDVLHVAALYPHIKKVQAVKSTGTAKFGPLHVDVVDTPDFYCESFIFLPQCYQSETLNQFLDLDDNEDTKVVFITDGEPFDLITDNARHFNNRYYSVQRVPSVCYNAEDQIINAVVMTLYASQCIDEAVACATTFLHALIPCPELTRIISVKCDKLHTYIEKHKLIAYVDYQCSRLDEAALISKYLHIPLITLKLHYGTDDCKETEDAHNLKILKSAYSAGVRTYVGFSSRLVCSKGVKEFIKHHNDVTIITEGYCHLDGVLTLLEDENRILQRLINHVSSDALYILPETFCVKDIDGDVLLVGDNFDIDEAVIAVQSHGVIIFHADVDELIIEIFKSVSEHKTFYRFGDTLFNSSLIKHVPHCVKYHEVLPALAGVEYCDTIINNSQAVEAVILSHIGDKCPLQFIRYVHGPRDNIVIDDCLRRVDQKLFTYDFEDCAPIEKCSISPLDHETVDTCLL